MVVALVTPGADTLELMDGAPMMAAEVAYVVVPHAPLFIPTKNLMEIRLNAKRRVALKYVVLASTLQRKLQLQL